MKKGMVRRTFLGGVAAVLLFGAAVFLPSCTTGETPIGEWEVGGESGHTLYAFSQVKGGRAEVWTVRAQDGSFSGPLLVAFPRLRSQDYDPNSGDAIEFQVWDPEDEKWQWVGVSTHRRIVRRGERYRIVLTGEKNGDGPRHDALFSTDVQIVADEEAWLRDNGF